MGRLMDRLKVKCRKCSHWHIPRRLTARYLDEDRKYIYLLECKECKHLWIDSVFKKGVNE